MVSLKDLASSILEKTRSGKLTWNELGANAFVTNIDDDSVTIDKSSSAFDLVFRNSQGKILETLSPHSANYYEIDLEGLYELVRRQVLKVDDALIEIKRSLDRL